MKIKRIETIAVSLPMVKPLKMSFEEVKSGENVLVRLETDDGIVGWGGAGVRADHDRRDGGRAWRRRSAISRPSSKACRWTTSPQ